VTYAESPSVPAGLTFGMNPTGLITSLDGNVALGMYAVEVTCDDGSGADTF